MSENNNYLYVLDYSDSSFHEITLSEEDKKLSAEEVLSKYGLHHSNCNWMYTKKEIKGMISHHLSYNGDNSIVTYFYEF